jgi:hypothetical protein
MQLVMDFTAPYQAHSGTSREAASAIKGKSARLREQVLDELRRKPATDEELATVLNLSGNTARPRRVELVEIGIVEDSGERRKTASGRNAVVWRVKESA